MTSTPRPVLATDLDGTLIPLKEHAQNLTDLAVLKDVISARDIELLFVTGRNFDLTVSAISGHGLPRPDWVFCDVGTSLYVAASNGEFRAVPEWSQYLGSKIEGWSSDVLREHLQSVSKLRLQEPEHQGPFKLSYYTDAEQLSAVVETIEELLATARVPWEVTASIDPFNGVGLVDLLPRTASKAAAIRWWAEAYDHDAKSIVFAGDSGNDLPALTGGYRAVLVGNANRQIAQAAFDTHRANGWQNRLFLGREPATSGVLEGCRWYGLADPLDARETRFGATVVGSDRTHFRVQAPHVTRMEVVFEDEDRPPVTLDRDDNGDHSGVVTGVGHGSRYWLRLDDHEKRPDPVSRFQPSGVHGPSQVIDPHCFPWTDGAWKGVAKRDLVIYELHIGAFTAAGTFREAIERLPDLVELGVTAVELMPVAQSPGKWNWGYDGVDLFAPRNTYGTPDDLRAFVDACHAHGLAVILDVVYNHAGPEGNYLAEFGPYFSSRHTTPWGSAWNFDEPWSEHVRAFIIANAIYWLSEFHLDGLRLDAVHFMKDTSRQHVLDELSEVVAAWADKTDRIVHLIAESNVHDPQLVHPVEENASTPPRDLTKAGDVHRQPYDAIWCDCLMHSLYTLALPRLRLTPRDYRGASDVLLALTNGYVFIRDADREWARPAAESAVPGPVASFVMAVQTHDSVGNHPQGRRLHQLTSASWQQAAAALVLMYPSIPMIFMGEESASESPFPFFADFEDPHLRRVVDEGRMREYPEHDWAGSLRPSDPQAFQVAKLGASDDDMRQWYRALLRLRKRGVAEGWLRQDLLTVSGQPADGQFSLCYARDEEQLAKIDVRLGTESQRFQSHARVMVGDDVLTSGPG